jgi:hypothetical protein
MGGVVRRPSRLLARLPHRLLLACALGLAGCAGSYFRAYQAGHPDWVFAFPDSEANLEQTVASLYAPPPLGTKLVIRRLEILRLDTEPWQPISFDELRSGRYVSTDEADYAVVADYVCDSRLDLQRYHGEKIGWYLLRKNRLRALDHYEFIEACTVSNTFVPAPPDGANVERELQQHVASEYPDSMVHVQELFQKGVVYARANRVEDARRMLQEGRAAFDASGDTKPTEFETPAVHIEVGRPADARAMRDLLVREIAAAEARSHQRADPALEAGVVP